jgi:hypothetical protein
LSLLRLLYQSLIPSVTFQQFPWGR